MDKRLDEGVAFAAVGVAVVESLKIYMSVAPSLRELRCADPSPDNLSTRQLLLDADMLALILVIAIGGAGGLLIRKWYPFLLISVTLLLVSAYYRSVRRSTNDHMFGDDNAPE